MSEGATNRAGDAIDVEAIIRRIREDIRRKGGGEGLPGYTHRFEAAGAGEEPAGRAGKELADSPPAVIHTPHLRYLNENWQVEPFFPITSHRPGIGPIVVGAKKLVRKAVLGLFLPIFARMQDFFSNVVAFDNELARRVDQNSDRSIRNDRLILDDIESLGHKIFDVERDVAKRFQEAEKVIVERMDLLFQKLDREILALERRIEEIEERAKHPSGKA